MIDVIIDMSKTIVTHTIVSIYYFE